MRGLVFFFFNDTATTEIYTLSLHDALPIYPVRELPRLSGTFAAETLQSSAAARKDSTQFTVFPMRSEEHTSELQSRQYLVCRLLLEKKKQSYHTLLMHYPPPLQSAPRAYSI